VYFREKYPTNEDEFKRNEVHGEFESNKAGKKNETSYS